MASQSASPVLAIHPKPGPKKVYGRTQEEIEALKKMVGDAYEHSGVMLNIAQTPEEIAREEVPLNQTIPAKTFSQLMEEAKFLSLPQIGRGRTRGFRWRGARQGA